MKEMASWAMRGWPAMLVAGLLATATASAPADQLKGPASTANRKISLVQQAVSTDPAVAERAIRELRAQDESGLQALIAAHAALLQQQAADPQPADPAWRRLCAALDAVSGQHDCYAAQLFWFTDFEQARAAARTQGRPILSLRLLGRLDEEFSCANSRFFRTTLYANQEVATYLREHFILHWKSVRPVPRVTIDFGDGRTLERTLTGNSIHYVLDAEGAVVDALPGLYGANAFLTGLKRAETLARTLVNLNESDRSNALANFHRDRLAALDRELAADLRALSIVPSTQNSVVGQSATLDIQPGSFPVAMAAAPNGTTIYLSNWVTVLPASVAAPSAQSAAKVAIGKGFVERPILERTQPREKPERSSLPDALDEGTWSKIAALHAAESPFDATVIRLVQEKSVVSEPAAPSAEAAGRRARSKSGVESPMLRQIRNLQRSISEDTVRNECLLHRQLHGWFATGSAPREVDALNARVYAELFLTPDSDPWLGLLPPDTFAALENGGVRMTATRK